MRLFAESQGFVFAKKNYIKFQIITLVKLEGTRLITLKNCTSLKPHKRQCKQCTSAAHQADEKWWGDFGAGFYPAKLLFQCKYIEAINDFNNFIRLEETNGSVNVNIGIAFYKFKKNDEACKS